MMSTTGRPSCPKCRTTFGVRFCTHQPYDVRQPARTYWICSCGWNRDATLEEAERRVYGEKQALSLAAQRAAKEEELQREYIAVFGKRKRGRHTMATEARKFYRIGLDVEDALPVFQDLIAKRRALRDKKKGHSSLSVKRLLLNDFTYQHVEAGLNAITAKVAARRYISALTNLPFDLVAEYHRDCVNTSKKSRKTTTGPATRP